MEKGQVFGVNSLGLLARYNLDTHSLRTYQCSFIEDLEEYSVTLPKSGMIVNGRLSELMMWVQDTEEKGYGLWRTPDSMAGGALGEEALEEMAMGYWKRESGSLKQLRLQDQVRHSSLWPTPNTLDGMEPKNLDKIMEYNQQYRAGRSYASMNLREKVVYGHQEIWPTPRAREGGAGKPGSKGSLHAQEKRYLAGVIQEEKPFPTPQASDHRDRGNLSTPAIKRRQEKGKQLALSMSVSETSGKLNPQWVEWLMGFPPGWTDLED